MNKKFKSLTRSIAIALFLSVLIVGVALAFTQSVVVMGFTIDYLGYEDLGNDQGRWTYAVTEPITPTHGLSHWHLEIGDCYYVLVDPAPGTTYTTLTSWVDPGTGTDVCTDGTYNCQQATYTAVYGTDGSTGADVGVKFEDPSVFLAGGDDPPDTHIFSFVLERENPRGGESRAVVKPGSTWEFGSIYGPICDPSAVTLTAFSASSEVATQATTMALVFSSAGVIFLGYIGFSRRKKS